MDLELRHLRVVVAVAEAGSVSAAAARLRLAQPALSTQLQRIERMLGGPLFARDHLGVRPTALGELVLRRARVLLPAADALAQDAVRLSAQAGAAGQVGWRIGALNGPILGGLVHRLSQDSPDTSVIPHPSWSARSLAASVGSGRLDVAVIGVCGNDSPPTEGGLVWYEVGVDSVAVLLPADHPLTGAEIVTLAEVAPAASRWAATPDESCFNACFAAACTAAGFSPRTLYETDPAGCVDLVLSGSAVAVVAPTFRRPPGTTLALLDEPTLRWRHLVGWHPASRAAEATDQIVQHAVEAFADSLDRNPRYARWLRGRAGLGVRGAGD